MTPKPIRNAIVTLLFVSCVPAPPTESSATQIAITDKNVATLEGYAQRVDGKVTSGSAQTMSLPPGCHVAVTYVREPLKDSNGTIRLGTVNYFEFRAKPGYRYVIEHTRKYAGGGMGIRSGRSSNSADVRTLVEYDERGGEVRRITEQTGFQAPSHC
jgi:hypothetical protein